MPRMRHLSIITPCRLLDSEYIRNEKRSCYFRRELVEIGGQFRIPEIMRNAGAQLMEVGTTNRTHLSDYSDVISTNTGLIMKVYTSNYEIVGFTSSVDEKLLADLANKNNVPFVVDAGSGNLINTITTDSTTEDTIKNILARRGFSHF